MRGIPKEVYPLMVMMSTTLVCATAFTVSSLFKPDVFLDKHKRMALFK